MCAAQSSMQAEWARSASSSLGALDGGKQQLI